VTGGPGRDESSDERVGDRVRFGGMGRHPPGSLAMTGRVARSLELAQAAWSVVRADKRLLWLPVLSVLALATPGFNQDLMAQAFQRCRV
jgi:hypothetical protein